MASGLSTYVFVLPEARFELDWLAEKLRERCPDADIVRNGSNIRMRWGEWGMSLTRCTDEMTVEECRELASFHTGDPLWRQVTKAVGRLELYADPDPEDRYYNEWLLVSEFFSSLPGLLAFDPMLGEWLGCASENEGQETP